MDLTETSSQVNGPLVHLTLDFTCCTLMVFVIKLSGHYLLTSRTSHIGHDHAENC